MAVQPGTRLGPYEILSPLGAGGMGEVYKATDTRLNRTVAIKVLPPQYMHNPEMKQRFDREAQVIGGLNHPHICTLYDIGREGVTDFLVMEYLEGETLAARIAAGPLPLDEALKVAVQVANHNSYLRFAVSADGKKFLVSQPGTGGATAAGGLADQIAAVADRGGTSVNTPAGVTVVLNWPQLLTKK